MALWQSYTQTVQAHTVVGDLRVYPHLFSPQLNNSRDVLVWLPPDYETSTRRYPVIYMHDGQNLFDGHLAPFGGWQVGEAMTALFQEGLSAIIVGLPNTGETRRNEYSPYVDTHDPQLIYIQNAQGDDYLRFVIDTVKPLIDSTFRTLTDAPSTGIAGSSMGGLISLYAFLKHPDVFGFCGAFSPAYGIGDCGLQTTLEQTADGHGLIYLDVGGKEGEVLGALEPRWQDKYPTADDAYVGGVRALRAGLLQQGYQDGQSLLYVEDAADYHNEPSWAKRLPNALRFMLKNTR